MKKADKLPSKSYKEFLIEVKDKVKNSQIKAALSVNQELIKLYWEIGRSIHEKQEKEGWGTQIIQQLAKDLQNSFPGIQGFSRTNLFRMRSFFQAYQKVPQLVVQLENMPFFKIPWGHNILIIKRVKGYEERLWYAKTTIELGWSRSSLDDCIKAKLYSRQGNAVTNFTEKLPSSQSKLACETLKDPYTRAY